MKIGLPLTNVRESSPKTLVVRAIKTELMPMQRSMRFGEGMTRLPIRLGLRFRLQPSFTVKDRSNYRMTHEQLISDQ